MDILKPPENTNESNFNSSTNQYNYNNYSQDYMNENGIFQMDTSDEQDTSKQSATISSTPSSTRQQSSNKNHNHNSTLNNTINSTDNSTSGGHMFSTEKKQKRLIGSLNKSVSKASDLNPGVPTAGNRSGNNGQSNIYKFLF